MNRLLPPLLLLLPFTALAQDSEECLRPPTQELADFKEVYVPQEFSFESFSWEIADVGVLASLLLASGLLSIRHKPKSNFTVLSIGGLLYFGLFRGGCICPVGATTNFCMGLAAPELIGRTVAVLFLMPLVAAFFFGRVFCTSACPLGAIQHLLSRKKGNCLIPRRLNQVLRLIPLFMLAATAWGALRSGIFLACRVDVYKPIFFTGHAWFGQLGDLINGTLTEPRLVLVGDLVVWLTLAAVLLFGYFVPRPFCRFACPYGVLLGFFSKIGLRRRQIDSASCFACIQCTKTCPVQAITAVGQNKAVKVDDFHCIQCGRCDGTCTGNALISPTPFPNTPIPNIGKN
ncbi:MAG: 4Fe-4S binding protein [Verrucomicrobiota bacterium]|nr:4Fe-4S binding protein [Verrucomicrobiota bacterium]